MKANMKLALSSAPLLIILLACGQATQQTYTPIPEIQITLQQILKQTSTITAKSTSTLSGAPTMQVLPALQPRVILSPASLDDPNLLFRNLILFTSRYSIPMPHVLTRYALAENGQPFMYNTPQLWAFSPDGQISGLITDPFVDLYEKKIAFHLSTIPYGRHSYASDQIDLNTDQFQKVPLPSICNYSTVLCEGFRFSPDGKYLGFYFEPKECGRGMVILETETGAVVHIQEARGHRFDFLPEGKIWLASGHCEGGSVLILDPDQRQYNSAGPEPVSGFVRNSAVGVAFVIKASGYQGMESAITAYDLRSNRVFFADRGVVGNVVWTTDGSHFLYDRAVVTRSPEGLVSIGPMEILIVARDGRSSNLASDPLYDFHLCPEPEYTGGECEWVGEWIKIRRITKTPLELIEFDDLDFCILYGKDCLGDTSVLTLNWRTGEIIPWDQASLTPPTETPTSTPGPSQPDLSQPPIYADPEGTYAYFVGRNGNSLWLVPREGNPVLWVQDGENFVYVP